MNNNQKDGEGVEVLNDGSKYEGKFSYGMKTKGTIKWKDGSMYKGNWKNN